MRAVPSTRHEARVKRHKIEVRPDRMVVVYDLRPEQYAEVYDDAARWRLSGWRMLSVDSLVTDFTGGVTNVLFDSGSGSATEIRMTILYERVEDLPQP